MVIGGMLLMYMCASVDNYPVICHVIILYPDGTTMMSRS